MLKWKYRLNSGTQKFKIKGGRMKRRLFDNGISLLIPDYLDIDGYQIENSAA